MILFYGFGDLDRNFCWELLVVFFTVFCITAWLLMLP